MADESTRDRATRPARTRLGWPAGITARLWSGLAAFTVLVVAATLVIFAGVRQQDNTMDNVVSDLHPLSSANSRSRRTSPSRRPCCGRTSSPANPGTSGEGYVEMLGDGEAGAVTPQQGKMLETIARSSVRLRSLVEDLLTLSRLESGAVHPVLLPVNLSEVISSAVDAVRPSVDAKHLALTCTPSPDALIVDGDAGQLDQVLSNLPSNAVKFTPEGGHVCVAAEAADGSALIRVTDTSIGIPERDQKELFSRFARASNATARRIPGTGLGLGIVRTIVVNHGGDVMLESVEGSGTTVTVRLPLLPAEKRRPQPVG